jgi:hypothetical protein
MNTFFKSHDSTQFFNYDHLSGIMLTIVQDGCHQGLFQRCDKNSLILVRQFSKEMTQGLDESVRTYHPSTVGEFFTMYQKTLKHQAGITPPEQSHQKGRLLQDVTKS